MIDHRPHKNEEIGNVKVSKISKVKFLLPWGTKLHIGVEDVLVLVNNVPRNTLQYNASVNESNNFLIDSGNRSTMVDKLGFMLQISCVPSFSEQFTTKNIILQSFPLFEMKNNKIIKLGNGETITIENPLMNNNIVRSFKCLPNVLVLELLLVSTKEYFTSEILPSKGLSSTPKFDSTTNNKQKYEMWGKTVGVKFRFNYLMY